ncbi:uncharacterized protein LOC114828246 [Galendromus occidentalis]|uniref:Uncharacterized protein LOC114828246 n=1 Tax=Galendromus occidentalis TaxID=34638 RepID=A0AAJ7WHL5_9ACAR|nr:uncharacterized protein LOC114828246 [Galendromus occidentalis]
MQHVRLKRFAKSCLASVRPKFPDRKNNARLDDPERIGAIFPLKEWDCESPLKEYFPIQDWLLFHGSSPDNKTRLIVFFERTSHQLAVFWIVLEIRGSILISKETYHADYSKGSTFCAGGLRLVVDAPLRRWSLSFNGLMVDQTRLQDVHVRIAARFAAFTKPFEFPRDIGPSKFARRYESSGKPIRRIREDMRG